MGKSIARNIRKAGFDLVAFAAAMGRAGNSNEKAPTPPAQRRGLRRVG
jgi:hypothetical protein